MTALGNRLNWRPDGVGLALCYGQRKSALLHVVPDKTYSGMFRIEFPDGRLSDMVNLTRAKDAGRAHGLAILARRSDVSISSVVMPPVRSAANLDANLIPHTTEAIPA